MTDTNKLIKEFLYDVTLGFAGVPGDPGQPYIPPQPARCSYGDPVEVCQWVQTIVQVFDELSGQFLTGPGDRKYVCRITREETCTEASPGQPYIPPTPAVPATRTQLNQDFNIGWNGRARSIDSLHPSRAGVATFKAKRSTAGVFIGFTQNHQDTGYLDIRHGFMLRHGGYKTIVNGAVSGEGLPYNLTCEFTILVTDGELRLSVIDTAEGGTISDSYTFSTPSAFTQDYTLSACIYMADDFVYEPSFYAASQGTEPMPALLSVGGEGTYASAEGVLEPLASFGIEAGFPFWLDGFTPVGPFPYGISSLPALYALGSDYLYTEGQQNLPALDSYGEGGLLEFAVAIGNSPLLPLSSYGSGLTGEIGQGDSSFQPLFAIASEGSYGFAQASLPALTSYAHAYEGPYSGFLYEFGVVNHTVTATTELLVFLNADMSVAGAMLGQLVNSGDISAQGTVTGSMTAGQVLYDYLLANAHAISAPLSTSLADYDTWVMNRRTEHFTRYEQFQFEAFTNWQGDTYAVRSDGIYKITGGTDDGEIIEASLDFGEMDFGTSGLKRIDGCYMGLSSDGTVYLRVKANGQTYTYAARNADEILRTQRFTTGKGMKASFVNFEFVNSGGADFEIDGVEFIAVPMTRRI